MDAEIVHDRAASRFEARFPEGTAYADYRLAGAEMQVLYTEVPRVLQGRGIAGEVVAALLAHARAEGLKVRPLCGYVRAYMRRHPDTHDLMA